MLRALGLTGFLGILALVGGFAVLAYTDPVVAGGVALVVVGAALAVHAAVRAVATKLGMGDML